MENIPKYYFLNITLHINFMLYIYTSRSLLKQKTVGSLHYHPIIPIGKRDVNPLGFVFEERLGRRDGLSVKPVRVVAPCVMHIQNGRIVDVGRLVILGNQIVSRWLVLELAEPPDLSDVRRYLDLRFPERRHHRSPRKDTRVVDAITKYGVGNFQATLLELIGELQETVTNAPRVSADECRKVLTAPVRRPKAMLGERFPVAIPLQNRHPALGTLELAQLHPE